MVRERRRLLISPERLGSAGPDAGRVELDPAELHYLQRVLRLRAGDGLDLVDGAGRLWGARLEGAQGVRLEQPLEQPLQRGQPPSPGLTLALALPKRDTELVWRMATELGVNGLQPLIASRSGVSGRQPLERWRSIVREAVEQCERLWLPVVADPQPAGAWLAKPRPGLALLATTRRSNLPSLTELLASEQLASELRAEQRSSDQDQPLAGISLAIGPEGGWSEAEEAGAEAAGWRAVSLGPAILRSATAAVAGMALLSDWRRLSCASCSAPWP
jgi:16S rRNA (uracil1498-N3)-methyltransferase